ncbi:MAG: hypothetical protein ACE5J3_09615 [Methanosarcinales archaeon]
MSNELEKVESNSTLTVLNEEKRNELVEMCTFISGDELQEGIEVTFLTEPFESGSWEGKYSEGDESKKFTILCIVQDEDSAQVKRLDVGRNFLSFLLGAMFLHGTSKISGKKAHIKRSGSKFATKYKIKFLEE